jgi:hypothetical protein
MQNKVTISALSILALIIITVVVVSECSSSRPGRGPANPFAYDAGEFEKVDPEQIKWKETKQIRLDDPRPRALAYEDGKIYILTESNLQVIDPLGRSLMTRSLQPAPSCLAVSGDGLIVVGFESHLAIFDAGGTLLEQSLAMTGDARFSSIALLEGKIFVADGGNRKVFVFNERLELTGEFEGESGVSDSHGFIVPDARFSLGVNPENELWITNPGLHALQNYTPGGRLRSYFQKSSFGTEGFSGCCNPVYFSFLPGGQFVTSEKGIIRIKVLKESGELESVVAAPEKFAGGTRAPALAVDEAGNILALDFDRKMIRVFEPL